MKNTIGVMQGRLLPKYFGRYQAHPVGCWQEEFAIAKKCGLDCIEFILDYNDAEKNPLLSDGGIDEIKFLSEKTGVMIKTICADYFMEAPLHDVDKEISHASVNILNRLLDSSEKLGVTDIVIPCVDQSSLNDSDAVKRFVNVIQLFISELAKRNINLSLETDLAPDKFKELLHRFNSKHITVNYDIGNSAALGYDPVEELNAYGTLITDIHIKDRILGGGPIELGHGNADFKAFFTKLKEFNYTGPFIMQAYRDEEGVAIFEKQLAWIKKEMEESYAS